MKLLHNLSKDARQRIIEILLKKRSVKELASELGVTEAAVSKFWRGLIHPSDETLMRAFEIADDEEKREILDTAFEDLMSAMEELLIDERYREKLMEMLNSMDRNSRKILLSGLVERT